MINKHPDSTYLMEYAAGSLSLAPGIAITTHLQFCDHCRRTIDNLQEIGGELLDSSASTPVSETLLDAVLDRIDNDVQLEAPRNTSKTGIPLPDEVDKNIDELAQSVPVYIQRFLPEGKLNWRFLSPSLKVAAISVGEAIHELAFHKIKAGGKAPEHDHRGTEITVVLKGSFSDEDGIYQPGDFMVRQAGDIHQPIAAQNEECICLSVLAAPIRLTGIKGILNPFLGFAPG